jgi:hypothetical protein
MHPHLSIHNNPACEEQIKALQACHEAAGYWGRLTGSCNDQKVMLDQCFRTQKKVVRKAKLETAREDRARWREICDRIDAQKRSGG